MYLAVSEYNYSNYIGNLLESVLIIHTEDKNNIVILGKEIVNQLLSYLLVVLYTDVMWYAENSITISPLPEQSI